MGSELAVNVCAEKAVAARFVRDGYPLTAQRTKTKPGKEGQSCVRFRVFLSACGRGKIEGITR